MDNKKIIDKLLSKKVLSYEEMEFLFCGYLNDQINDEEMTVVLKSICKNGLTNEETFNLVDIFIKSGDVLNLDNLGLCVDKHSTGGVGDKTTLIVAPIVACCGTKIAKMSGRALGHTGGTIDKLEGIKVKTELSEEDFVNQINKINMAITSQTAEVCPMDKKVYALRDVTNTTESIPLIASSIMSKKIASGASKILIDIKVGKGALIKNKKDAKKLAKLMIEIGKKYNREVRCMLTKMDNPLGDNIGNNIEILEVIDILQNKKKNNLYNLCVKMSAELISMAKNIKVKEAEKMVLDVISNGDAYKKFEEFIKCQNGNLKIKLKKPKIIYSTKNGYIKSIDSLILGKCSMKLGAGRINKDDKIDYNAGIILNKNVKDFVRVGDELCYLYGNNKFDEEEILNAFMVTNKKVKEENVIIKIIR